MESTSRDAAITASVICWRSDSSSRDRPGAAPAPFAAAKAESFSLSDSTPMIRAICKAFGGSLERSPSLRWVSAKRGLASVAARWLSWAGHVVNRTKRSPEMARAQRIMDFESRIATVVSLLISTAESWNNREDARQIVSPTYRGVYRHSARGPPD